MATIAVIAVIVVTSVITAMLVNTASTDIIVMVVLMEGSGIASDRV